MQVRCTGKRDRERETLFVLPVYVVHSRRGFHFERIYEKQEMRGEIKQKKILQLGSHAPVCARAL